VLWPGRLEAVAGRITLGPQGTETGLGVQLCVSRSVRDTARMLDSVHGPGVGDTVIAAPPDRPYINEVGADPGRLRIGLLDADPRGTELHSDCVDAVRSAATLLESLGHDVSLGYPAAMSDASFTSRFMAIWAANMAIGIDNYGLALGRELTEQEVEVVNWTQARFADQVTSVDYAKGLAAAAEFRRAIHQWWTDGWDLLVSPTLSEPPVRIGEHDPQPGDPMAGMKRAFEWVSFTPAFNVSGQPAINVPLHLNDAGLPVGVQLVAAYGREDVLLQVASQLESAQPWPHLPPPHPAELGDVPGTTPNSY